MTDKPNVIVRYDLKPCPFCGSDGQWFYVEDFSNFTIECQNRQCGCTYVGSTEQGAVTGWNNRQVKDDE